MWAVTPRFLQALQFPHKTPTVVTCTPPGGTAQTLQVQSGTVSVDATQRIRRQASLTVFGLQSDYDLISTPGAVFHIDHGIDYGGGQTELVPVFHGELVDGSQGFGNGTITLGQLADHSNWLSRSPFLTPYSPISSTLRTQAISDIVTAARPGTVVAITASDAGTVGSANTWTDSRLDAITALCKDGNMDAAFRPDGTFLIRDLPNLSSSSVWTANGVLESGSRTRPMDKMYNTVVVRPSATDGSQTWSQQVAQITDVSNPRHPSKIGVVPYFWASPTAKTAQSAMLAAESILYRVLGTTETLSLGMISNPALDGNDVIRVITPQVNTDPANAYQHFIDSLSLDLVTGSMTAATRSQAVSTI